MGVVQKIFYFHVPCAIMLFPPTFVCAAGSLAFLFKGSERGDRLALAAGELGVLFGVCVLVSGPLWGRKAWGVYWQWDARLTSSLLLFLILIAYLLARSYGGPGGRRLAAALALFAAVDVPLVYKSVDIWRTDSPARPRWCPSLDPAMRPAFWASFALITLRVRRAARAAHAPGGGARGAGRAAPGSRRPAGGPTIMKHRRPASPPALRCHPRPRSRWRSPRRRWRWRRSSRRSRASCADNVPAVPFVGIAYGFIWLAVLVYVLVVARGLGRVNAELDELRRKLDGARRRAAQVIARARAGRPLVVALHLHPGGADPGHRARVHPGLARPRATRSRWKRRRPPSAPSGAAKRAARHAAAATSRPPSGDHGSAAGGAAA